MASPRVLNPQVQRPGTRQHRVVRQPSMPFNVITRPWRITPWCLLPVLPGETMTSCFIQGQFWTDPLAATMKNIPWYMEMFVFYVKFRDLPGWEDSADGLGRDLIQMIESGEDLSPNKLAAGRLIAGTAPGGIDYGFEGMKRIVECYFREEGQAWDNATDSSGLPLAHAHASGMRDVMDRLSIAASAEDRRIAMPGFIGGLEYQARMDYAANMNQSTAELQAMDYEDIVRAAGGQAVVRDKDREDLHVPELLGKLRMFDYPTNTVEPSTGAPSTAFGGRVRQGLKQNFRFPEFGHIIGLMVMRPKAYWGAQEGTFASMMQTRTDWFMASDDPNADSHWKTIPDGEGPLKSTYDTANLPYTIDWRQLLWHGEQFLNYTVTGTSPAAFVSLPTVGGGKDYPNTANQDNVFKATTTGVITMDGVIDCSIKTYEAVNPYRTQLDRQWSNRD